MKKNFKFIIFILIASIALYFTKVNYSEHSISKSINACIIAKAKTKKMKYEDAKKFCEKEIKKK
tara:strand:+ start:790 stop:981 length:192 start_codon:yes stop_codon:yes gene_type:complete